MKPLVLVSFNPSENIHIMRQILHSSNGFVVVAVVATLFLGAANDVSGFGVDVASVRRQRPSAIPPVEKSTPSSTTRLFAEESSIQASTTTTRRQSFGDILGSALLPVAAVSTAAQAADEYPFKVSSSSNQTRVGGSLSLAPASDSSSSVEQSVCQSVVLM